MLWIFGFVALLLASPAAAVSTWANPGQVYRLEITAAGDPLPASEVAYIALNTNSGAVLGLCAEPSCATSSQRIDRIAMTGSPIVRWVKVVAVPPAQDTTIGGTVSAYLYQRNDFPGGFNFQVARGADGQQIYARADFAIRLPDPSAPTPTVVPPAPTATIPRPTPVVPAISISVERVQ